MAHKPTTKPKSRSRAGRVLTDAQLRILELRKRKREQQELSRLSRQLERLIEKSDSDLRAIGVQLAARFDLIDWSRSGAASVRRGERAEQRANNRQARSAAPSVAGDATPANPFDELASPAERAEVETV